MFLVGVAKTHSSSLKNKLYLASRHTHGVSTNKIYIATSPCNASNPINSCLLVPFESGYPWLQSDDSNLAWTVRSCQWMVWGRVEVGQRNPPLSTGQVVDAGGYVGWIQDTLQEEVYPGRRRKEEKVHFRYISGSHLVLVYKKKNKKNKKIKKNFYTALFISPEGIPKLPLVTGAWSFLKPSQLPGGECAA